MFFSIEMSTFLQEKIVLNFLLGKYIEKKNCWIYFVIQGLEFFSNSGSQAKHMGFSTRINTYNIQKINKNSNSMIYSILGILSLRT